MKKKDLSPISWQVISLSIEKSLLTLIRLFNKIKVSIDLITTKEFYD